MGIDLTIFASLAFLFGIAAQFRAAAGYVFLRRVIGSLEGRLGILYAVVVVTAVFSPFILNDVLILVLTPVLVRYCKQFKVDITPLLVAEITFTNISSSLTPLGNPQNILLWQASGVSARDFVAGTWLPLVLSGALAVVLLFPFRKRAGGAREMATTVGSWAPALYLFIVAVGVFSLSLLGVPDVLALAFVFVLGFAFNIKRLRQVAREFDVRSLLILCLLVGAVLATSVVVQPFVGRYVARAASGNQPYSALFVGGLANVISNVPATQLVLSTSVVTPHAAPVLAVEAGLAGNIDPIGSFANVLALVMVRRSGMAVRRAIALQVVIGIVSFLPAFL